MSIGVRGETFVDGSGQRREKKRKKMKRSFENRSRVAIHFLERSGTSGMIFINAAYGTISGQLVTSEIIMASESGCPIEYHRIDVDKCDPVFDKECQGNKYIPFRRADYDRQTGRSPNSPREQVISRSL